MDGVTFKQIDASGVEVWLAGLREELVSKTYRPDPVRRVTIPKPGGGERPLGIPTIRDRVVQTAAKIVLEPIFEADFEDSAYGYRPRRSAVDAVKETHRLICRGYTDVVDADLSKYFDTIPHSDLLKSVARRIVDRHVLWLIKLWLKAPVEERDGDGRRRMSGGKSNTRGTPQGGVASPLLADHLHEPIPEALASQRTRRSLPRSRRQLRRRLRHPQPRSCGRGADVDEGGDDEAGADAQRGENLGEGRPAGKLRFPWLYAGTAPFSERWPLVSGRGPSKKSVLRIKTKVSELLTPGNKGAWPEVQVRLNRLLGGWSAYFSHGALASAYQAVDDHVYDRVRSFLCKRHKAPGRGTKRFSREHVYEELEVLRLRRGRRMSPPCALR